MKVQSILVGKYKKRPTIQGVLQNALIFLFLKKNNNFWAGRTDTGVHACAQSLIFFLIN